MDKLEQCSCDTDILSVLSEIEGPFAFVYFDASQNKIWFGRDCLGRRSLLWQQSETSFILSSVASTDLGAWQEVPANGFYAINLNLPYEENGLPNPNNHHITLYPWKYHPMESKLQYLKESNELVN
jgi:asparagine synthetase B (glutamine-hydrolysing)